MTQKDFVIELIEKLMSDEKYGLEAPNVRYYVKGLTAGEDEEMQNDIINLNRSYFNSSSKTLLGNFVMLWHGTDNQMVSRYDADYLYSVYKEKGWDEVIKSIDSGWEIKNKNFDGSIVENIHYYDLAKENLIIRAVNYDKSSENIKESIYKRIGDVALVIYAAVGEDKNSFMSFKVPKQLLDDWKVTEETVWECAMNNTMTKAPLRIYSEAKGALRKKDVSSLIETDDIKPIKVDKRFGLMITTAKELNGAIAFFYPGVMDKLAKLVGGNYYIAFTGIHEVHIHPEKTTDARAVAAALLDMNRFFGPADKLSDRVYLYDAKKKEIMGTRYR